jgi:hypothetical protein
MDANQKLGNKLALGKHRAQPAIHDEAVKHNDGHFATTAD